MSSLLLEDSETEAGEPSDVEADGGNPTACDRSIGEIRDYLIRQRVERETGFKVPPEDPTVNDIALGEHIAICEACQEVVEELSLFEVALREEYNQLAPVMKAVVHSAARRSARPKPDIDALQKRFAETLAGGIETARRRMDPRLETLDREYEKAFRSPPRRMAFHASCKAKFRKLDRDRSTHLQEGMIAVIGERRRLGDQRRLCDIPAAKDHPFEFLLGICSSDSVARAGQRVWFHDPRPDDPLGIVIDTNHLVPA